MAAETKGSAISPGTIRSRMEQIQAKISSLEADLAGPISKGIVGLTEVRHELVEGSDALHRAVEILDNNYASMS
jgi:hypothetical protein